MTAAEQASVRLPLGHVHQLVSAALGYRSYAAYAAAVDDGSEASSLEGVVHALLDQETFRERLADIGYDLQADDIGSAVGHGFAQLLPDVKLHGDAEDLADSVRLDVESDITNGEDFSAVHAETNAGMAEIDDLELVPVQSIDESTGEWVFEASGTASLEVDGDRPYAGNQISVCGRVTFLKLGRRLLGEAVVEDVGAAVVGYDVED